MTKKPLSAEHFFLSLKFLVACGIFARNFHHKPLAFRRGRGKNKTQQRDDGRDGTRTDMWDRPEVFEFGALDIFSRSLPVVFMSIALLSDLKNYIPAKIRPIKVPAFFKGSLAFKKSAATFLGRISMTM